MTVPSYWEQTVIGGAAVGTCCRAGNEGFKARANWQTGEENSFGDSFQLFGAKYEIG
ncbi:hypothetical protein [Mesorhizobium sp. M0029]|uniref:hypothetical protein n=1 Tax=Mesorhizobium sp. M0029 TaxID=2956850 RepID=UPI00333B2B1A